MSGCHDACGGAGTAATEVRAKGRGAIGRRFDDLGRDPIADMMDYHRRAGWSLGYAAIVHSDGPSFLLVSGLNGENLIRAEAATQAEAHRTDAEQARTLGMLRR